MRVFFRTRTSRTVAIAGIGICVAVGVRAFDVPVIAVNAAAMPVRGVRTHRGVEFFHVSSPALSASAAWRINADLAGDDGVAPAPTPGYTLTATVIVRTDRADGAAWLAGQWGVARVSELDAAPGFLLAQAASVEEAITLADALGADASVKEAYVDGAMLISDRTVPSDPRFGTNQWSLRNIQQPLFDANLEPAWDMGFTGQGVVVGITETGRFQTDHVDLAANFNSAASQTISGLSSHATGVAGVVGMVANNGLFGAGAAYNADISVQVISGGAWPQATGLGFRNDLNHIKNNSWGPADDLNATTLPSVVLTAFETGVSTGRGGLGEIFVWAAGNGGAIGDRVDYDPYASSRYVISVGAIGDADTRANYNETGSSMMVVTQSDGNTRRIYSLTTSNGENTVFGGTSASSPLASGIVALMLEARPELTWRDVQHILIGTTRKNDAAHGEWVRNGGGRWVNYHYGYGALDAGAAVSLALNWPLVKPETLVDSGSIAVAAAIPDNDASGVTQTVAVAENIRIESVELVMNATTSAIGNLEIVLTSPGGHSSILALARGSDAQDNYSGYLFTSRRHWDESTAGDWSVRVADRINGTLATWNSFRLKFHGTAICNGDVDNDGDIDLTDLAYLLATFGLCATDDGYDAYADFTADECVDLSDLASLLTVFGGSCE